MQTALQKAAMSSEENLEYLGALSFYRALLKLNNGSAEPTIGLARILRKLGRSSEAIPFLKDSLKINTEHVELLEEFGKALLAVGGVSEGVEALLEADELRPNNWRTVSALAVGFDRLKLDLEADYFFERALKLSDKNPVVLNNLALSWSRRNRLQEAISTLEIAIKSPNSTQKMYRNLASLYAKSGDAKKAEAVLEAMKSVKTKTRIGKLNRKQSRVFYEESLIKENRIDLVKAQIQKMRIALNNIIRWFKKNFEVEYSFPTDFT